MPRIKLSLHDIEKSLNSVNLDKFEIFREYNKIQNNFVASDNFFVSSHNNDNLDDEKYIKIIGTNDERYIEKKNNVYLIHYNKNYNDIKIEEKVSEVNLIIIKNLNIGINNDNIDIKKLIKDEEISNNECDELIKDLYYSSYYYKKFNVENKNTIGSNTKYLFKIKKGELNIKNQIEQCHLMI